MDIRNWNEYCDLVIWQDGPEHMTMSDAQETIDRLKLLANKIIISTPKGEYVQGEMYGNKYEMHLSIWELEDYNKIGFTAKPYRTRGGTMGIIGYWEKS